MIAKLLLIILIYGYSLHSQAVPHEEETWYFQSISDESFATARHEASAVTVNGKLYLLGGRRNPPVEVYDPANQTWQNLGPAPVDMHHFQAIVIGSKIYAIGAFTGSYPAEPSISDIHVFDTDTATWSIEGSIPAERLRGSAGAVVYAGKIYLVGGNTLGHSGGSVAWFDEYDPETGTWLTLPDAPNARDHFQAVVVNDQLIATGGRTTDIPNPFDKAVSETDIYDFATGAWSSGAPLPTVRAGTISAVVDSEVVVVGGEIDTSNTALATVEIYNPAVDEWRTLQPLNFGRHSGGGAIIDNKLHMVAGSLGKGGGPESSSHETLVVDGFLTTDSDADGVSNDVEINELSTDPNNPDSDNDGLLDGLEIGLNTNPLNEDTDDDSLNDFDELNVHSTNPTLKDSDHDGLDDNIELSLGLPPTDGDADDDGLIDGLEVNQYFSDPLVADTDEDTLSDGDEVNLHGSNPLFKDSDSDGLDDDQEVMIHMTDPTTADTDEDGLFDGAEIEAGTDPNDPDSDDDTILDGDDADPLTAAVAEKSGGGVPDLWLLFGLGSVLLQRVSIFRRRE